jgi:hypothetical protein
MNISIQINFFVLIAGSMMSGMNMPQGGQASNPTTTMAISQQGTKEAPNTATICRIGQETVQEIVTRYRHINKFIHSLLIYLCTFIESLPYCLQFILHILLKAFKYEFNLIKISRVVVSFYLKVILNYLVLFVLQFSFQGPRSVFVPEVATSSR